MKRFLWILQDTTTKKKSATAPSECPTNHFSLPIVDRPLLCCCIKTKMHIAHTASFERLFSSFTSPSHSSPLFSVVFFAKQVTVVCQLIYVLFTMKWAEMCWTRQLSVLDTLYFCSVWLMVFFLQCWASLLEFVCLLQIVHRTSSPLSVVDLLRWWDFTGDKIKFIDNFSVGSRVWQKI